MMNYSVESKSLLAKLLATENIKIEHRNAPTAAFDLKNRTLICPIWKDMSGQMYDLLLGHEVSHALETPYEGWHNAVCERGKNYKHFLNVVEDARIEKKIKRRYPGIRRSFIGAYKQLLEEDFFGIANQDLEELFFIDRLNIYVKAGVSTNIKFKNAEEQALLKLVEQAETWNDVLYATEQIWEYSKQEQQQEIPSQQTTTYVPDENGEYFDDDLTEDQLADLLNDAYDDADNLDGNDEPVDFDEDEGESETDDTTPYDGDDDADDTESEGDESDDAEISHDNDDEESEDFGDPKCMTDENFRNNEDKLLSTEVTAYNYINIPKLKDESKIISKPQDINNYLTEFFQTDIYNKRIDLNKLYSEFKNKNDRYVGLLAKQFEMRKAAKAHSRSKIASTGDININKIYKYQLDDEIFRKATVVPKGKSHGLVLLLDMSGSMANNMAGSIEQILVLTSFCKKVNIPFKVYGFTSQRFGSDINECFEQEENTMQFNSFNLIEFMNSKMKTTEFNVAVKNMCGLSKLYEDSRRNYIPSRVTLGRTPLVESMITLQPIVKEFRKVNNLDLVNMVVVHDGDADSIDTYKTPGQYSLSINSSSSQRFVIRDSKEKLDFVIQQGSSDRGENMRKAVYEWFKQTTGTKIFGFFITSDRKTDIINSLERRYYDPKTGEKPKFEQYSEQYHYYQNKAMQFKKDKFTQSKNPGYENFFLVLGGKSLQIEDDELVIVGKVTMGKLHTAIRKMTKSKQVNRVLATKFIEGIAI